MCTGTSLISAGVSHHGEVPCFVVSARPDAEVPNRSAAATQRLLGQGTELEEALQDPGVLNTDTDPVLNP